MKFKDFEDFQDMIEDEFLECKKKNILFGRLPVKLRKWGEYPSEYIEYYFDTISEPMPLHAAVSIIYFREYKFFSEKLSEFEKNLYHICEQKFIKEISSDSPDLEYCANLHIALSVLNPEHIEEKITQAVEKISEQWKNVLFQQINICIQAVNKLETAEQSLLAPILKSFYINYSAEINCNFLLKELEQVGRQRNGLSTNRAAEITLSEILKSTIKNKYFSYFKILYSLFPNWHMYQNEIEWEEFMELAFKYADFPEHLIDLLYVCLEVLKGNKGYEISNIENWYKKIISFSPENQVEKVISFIYYSVCIQADEENIQKYVSEMPKYKENKLFSEILPAESLPIGGIFVVKNTEKILKNNPQLLKEYLEKIGKNNIYHFDTELDCPEAPPTNIDGEKAIDLLCMYCTLETTLHCYFNTHIRKIYDIASLCFKLSRYYYNFRRYNNFYDYIFKGTVKIKDDPSIVAIKTSQFLQPEKLFFTFGFSQDQHELRHSFEENPEKEVYFKLGSDHDSLQNGIVFISAYLDKRTYTENIFNEIICEIIETGRITEERIKQIKEFYSFYLLTPNNIKSFVEALETLSEFPEHQKLLMTTFKCSVKFCYESSLWNKDIIKKYYLIAMKLHLKSHNLLCPIKPECMIDMKDIGDSGFKTSWKDNDIKGTVYPIENKLRFVPENAVCEKIPIFADLECITFSDENEITGNETVYYADIEYLPSKQMFIVTSLITEKYKKYCEELNGKLKNLDEAIELLIRRLCKDDSLFDELKEKLEERKNIIDEFKKFSHESAMFSISSETIAIANDIIKKCDCDMIVKVYLDTVLREQLDPDTLGELVSEHGKREEMIKYLESFEEQEQ